MFKSIAEIKAANVAAGLTWFGRSEINFFNTRVRPNVYGGRYFITGDRPEYSDPERFTIRRADDNGKISTVGDFCAYATIEDAKRAVANF